MNPEDEDDVVPDQHAAFGIQRAGLQGGGGKNGVGKEPVWRDLGLEELVRRGEKRAGERTGEALRRRGVRGTVGMGMGAGVGGGEGAGSAGNGGMPR